MNFGTMLWSLIGMVLIVLIVLFIVRATHRE